MANNPHAVRILNTGRRRVPGQTSWLVDHVLVFYGPDNELGAHLTCCNMDFVHSISSGGVDAALR